MTVCDEAAASIAFQSDRSQLRLCLRGYLPPASGIAYHEVLLTSAATVSVASWTISRRIAHDDAVVLSDLELPCGAALQVATNAVSGAQVRAPSQYTSVVIDCTAPLGGAVAFGRDGAAALNAESTARLEPPHCVVEGDVALAHWGRFIEDESSLSSFETRLAPLQTDDTQIGWHGEWRSVGLQRSWLLPTIGLSRRAPFVYELSVRACNAVGLCTGAEARPTARLAVVRLPPRHSDVALVGTYDGGFLNSSGRYSRYFLNSSGRLQGLFSGFADATLPLNTLSYDACVGTSPQRCDVLPLWSTWSPVRCTPARRSCGWHHESSCSAARRTT